ncbi:hypothetical protein HerbRD11066_44660 [Herbidospora sp. RD11066]
MSVLTFTATLLTCLVTVSPPARASTVGGPITRSEVLQRAQNWVDRGIKYNLTRSAASLTTDPDGSHKYGPDCSGYVSMVWHLSPGQYGGLNTSGFAAWSGKTYLSGLSQLRPGDALLKDGHIELFVRWKNSADRTQGAYVYSLNGTGNQDANGWENDWAKGPTVNSHGQTGFNSWSEMQGYDPIRYDNIVEDGAGGGGSTGSVTGDNLADLLGQNAAGELLLYANEGVVNGGQSFKYPPTKIGHGWNNHARVMIGKVNADNHPDLIGVNPAGDMYLYTHKGTLNGENTYNGPVQIGHGWSGMTEILLGDVTGDGRADLLGQNSAGEMLLYANEGIVDGVQSFAHPPTDIGHGWNNMDRVLLGDVTGDGKADLLGENPAGELLLYSNRGMVDDVLSFTYPPTKIGHGWNNHARVMIGRVNADAHPDLVGVNPAGDMYLYTHKGTVNGESTFNGPVQIGHGWSGMSKILLG